MSDTEGWAPPDCPICGACYGHDPDCGGSARREVRRLRSEVERLRGLDITTTAWQVKIDGFVAQIAEVIAERDAAEDRLRKVEALPVRHLFDDAGIKPFVRLADIEMALAAEPAEETDLLPGRSPAADMHDDTGAVYTGSSKVDATYHEPACDAVNLEEGRPASNPPHVCILPDGHFPGTDHEDYSGNKWRKPGQPHELVVP